VADVAERIRARAYEIEKSESDLFKPISQGFGFLGRFRWEFQPGSEIFVALGQSALIPGTDFRFQTTQLSFRIGHTLRF